MIKVYVNDETSLLKAVVLGTAESFGGTPKLEEAYDPKTREHILNDSFPLEADLRSELTEFETVLKKYGVTVYRPQIIENCNQVFSRDIGFVIEDKFIIPNILKHRRKEIDGIDYIVDQIDPDHLLEVPDEVRIEGGDVMPWKDHIFVGYSKSPDFEKYVVARTNEKGVQFLKESFPAKKVMAFELKKSDTDPRDNALHLDCCFQPIGRDSAIIYKGGFKNPDDYEFLVEFFGRQNLIEITREEMYFMNSNVFSIAPDVIVSEKGFTRLNGILRERGFIVEEINFAEISKMEGLLRCATLPLLRTF
ncbi:dimethylarginine dimethylaminohydrolase family protein [Fulvivirga sedimenti]|uniref:arginine deiminase n=1 Tax=Fulvivirga sedimenti TaxID=2879465 RepID=A0A9X1HT46_9BACT|nr:arginine deiminase family protein [Fulvivirga sedimenti]MCA6075301.1 amidinotransferase [Fulvivirga sedimenti]MCA6076478.1 amidinotransferase [Fulvivirga sedimenti]MCA6077606.1 amidinotransferase [Fulvivirga sedimenti]